MGAGGTFFADRVQLEGWFARARAGEAAIYAIGEQPDPGHAIAQLVHGWRDRGEARCERDGTGSLAKFKVRKTEPRPGTGEVRRLRLDADFEQTPPGRMLRLLSRCANFGLPCPSYQVLADQLELDDRFQARRVFDKLVSSGRVLSRSPDHGQTRVVTIVATGKRTAWTGTTVPAEEIEEAAERVGGERR